MKLTNFTTDSKQFAGSVSCVLKYTLAAILLLELSQIGTLRCSLDGDDCGRFGWLEDSLYKSISRSLGDAFHPYPHLDTLKKTHFDETLMYVHVGKTAGTTLERVLRASCEWYDGNEIRMNSCLEWIQVGMGVDPDEVDISTSFLESNLSKHVKATLHMDPRHHYYEWINETQAFLVSVRNPVSRLVSAFNYEHPNNTKKNRPSTPRRIFYVDCFPMVEDFAGMLRRYTQEGYDNFSDAEKKCFRFANKTVLGTGYKQSTGHLLFNYEYYAWLTYWLHPERNIYIVRTEHIWPDLMKLEDMYGGNGNESFHRLTDTVRMGSDKFKVKSELSPTGVHTVCCYLAKENQVYEYLVRRAVNLEDSEKRDTLFDLYQKCNVNELVTVNQNYSDTRAIFDWEDWARYSCFDKYTAWA